VEEMAEGQNKELVKEMIANWQSQGIWGHEEDEEEGWEEEGWEEEEDTDIFYLERQHWKDVATYNERNSH
jgi:hypothetical protein